MMSLDVFICFSRQDMGVADKTCQALEAAGIRCWMAHRDIVSGRNHLGATLEAVDCCRAIVLILSFNTDISNAYFLERAAGRGVPIIWLMLDHTALPAEFTELRKSAIVIDASTPPLESHFRLLAAQVKPLLSDSSAKPINALRSSLKFANPFDHSSEGYSRDQVEILQERAAPRSVGFPPDAFEDEAVESALCTAAEVLGAHRTNWLAQQHDRELPTATARSAVVARTSIRPISSNRRKNTGRKPPLLLAG